MSYKTFKECLRLFENIFSMSGGEKQSLAFASVYAMQPSVFVLDEPSANLDAPAIETLRRQIKQVKKNGHTIVIAEHRLYFLADLADRIVYLKNGKIEQIWKPKEFLSLSKDR
ncbi:MAG: AAA family ATPase, partial [Fusobacterium sp.]